jgi:hypothetical protein
MSGPRKRQGAKSRRGFRKHSFPQSAISRGKQFVSCWRRKRPRNSLDSDVAEKETVVFSGWRCSMQAGKSPQNYQPQAIFS